MLSARQKAGALLLNVVLAAFAHSPALARMPTAKTTPDGACAAGWDVPPGARGVLRWLTDSALIIHVYEYWVVLGRTAYRPGGRM